MLAVLNLHHKDHAGSVGTILCAAFDTLKSSLIARAIIVKGEVINNYYVSCVFCKVYFLNHNSVDLLY